MVKEKGRLPGLKKDPGKRPQTVCVRSISRKSKDLVALGSREVMAVIKVAITK